MDQIWKWDTEADNWAFYGYYMYDDDQELAAWHRYNKAEGTFTAITDDDVLHSGDGFYFYNAHSSKAKTITLAGGVKPLTDTKVYTIAKKSHNVIAYPWPVDIKIADIPKFYTGASVPKASTSWNGMDQIWCWDYENDNWAFYGNYMYDDDLELSAWHKYNKTEGTFTLCTDADVIKAGQGFYFFNAHTSKAKTITFTYPVPAAE